jgi:hypothetical protein
MGNSCGGCTGRATRVGLGGLVLGSGLLAALLPKCPWCLLAYASLLGVALDLPTMVRMMALLCAGAALFVALRVRRRGRSS